MNPNIAVTCKPAEVRMGKGKGTFEKMIARVNAGSIIFELQTENEILARQAYAIASSKLPLKLRFIKLVTPTNPLVNTKPFGQVSEASNDPLAA